MKRMLALGAVTLILTALSACGKRVEAPTAPPTIPIQLVESRPSEVPTEPEETTVPVVTVTPTEAPTEAPTEKPTEKPVEKPKPTEAPAAKPNITKHPTGEKVKAGEQTWFIAHADGDTGIRWWFNPPEGGRGKSPEEIMKAMPGLKVEILPEDTLGLTNIPQALNGWLIQAEFYNAYGSSWSNGAKLTVDPDLTEEEILKAYNPVLLNCLYIQSYDGDPAQVDAARDPYELIVSRGLMEGTLGYALKDLDGNGIPELIVANPGYDELVVAMFTLKDKTPVKLFAGWSRNRYYLHTGGKILNEGSSGAGSSSTGVYSVKDGKLRLEESTWSSDADGTQKFYYSNDGETGAGTEITQQKYQETCDRMRLNKLPLPELTSLS